MEICHHMEGLKNKDTLCHWVSEIRPAASSPTCCTCKQTNPPTQKQQLWPVVVLMCAVYSQDKITRTAVCSAKSSYDNDDTLTFRHWLHVSQVIRLRMLPLESKPVALYASNVKTGNMQFRSFHIVLLIICSRVWLRMSAYIYIYIYN